MPRQEELPVLLTTEDFKKLVDQARSNPGEWTPWWQNAPVNNVTSSIIIRAQFSIRKGPTQGRIVYAAADMLHPGNGEDVKVGFGFSPAEATRMLARRLYGTKNYVKAVIRVLGPWVLALTAVVAGLVWFFRR